MGSLAKVIAAAVCVGVGFAAWRFLYTGESGLLGAVAAPDTRISTMGLLLGYAATLLGVFMGAGYRHLGGSEQPSGRLTSVRRTFMNILRSRDLWAGIFASPLVFGVIFKTVDGIGLSGLVVIAVQNGFFCHFVIQQLSKKPSTT
jgi:hypothetical protein